MQFQILCEMAMDESNTGNLAEVHQQKHKCKILQYYNYNCKSFFRVCVCVCLCVRHASITHLPVDSMRDEMDFDRVVFSLLELKWLNFSLKLRPKITKVIKTTTTFSR